MKSITIFSLVLIAAACISCNSNKSSVSNSDSEVKMELTNKEKAVALIESLETGAQEPIGYINPGKYTQHNLAVGDGLAGFGEVVENAPEGGFKAKVVRAFHDGDYVFLHVNYDFFGPKAAFDIFRLEAGKIVEHWDIIETIPPQENWKNSNGKF
jgi:predicted SnoaL-like aldol condensation-catalyzing enzyme